MTEFTSIGDDAAFRLWLVQSLTELNVKMTSQMSTQNDHETRIRSVETKVWLASGSFSVVTIVASIIIKKMLGI